MHERRGNHVLEAEAPFGRGDGILVARDFLGRAIRTDTHAGDVGRLHAELALRLLRAIDGRKGVAAAGVVLDRHHRDVVHAAERGHRFLPVRPVAHGAAHARFAFDHVERAGDAFTRPGCGEDPGFRRVTRVQGLGHGVHAERLLQRGRHGGAGGERMREAFGVEPVELGGRGGRAERADGAGVVPVLVVRAPHGGADAR